MSSEWQEGSYKSLAYMNGKSGMLDITALRLIKTESTVLLTARGVHIL